MQSSRKASGALTFEVGMDTTTAFNSVSTLKRTVRELTNEWKSQYHALMQIGQVEEANKSKRDGLNRVTEKEAELNKFLNGMYEHSASLKGLNAQKQNRLTDELLHSETALARQRAELERVNRQLILNSDTVYKANENAKITKELSTSRVASLQAEGREYSATAAKMAGYSDRIKATQEQLRQQTKSMAEFRRMAQQDAFNNYTRTNEKKGIKGNKTLDDFANAYETDSDYKRSLIQNNKTKASLATLKHEARDYRLQLFQLKEESKSYSSVTSSMVSQLKAQRRENTAGLYELKRLQRQLSIDTNLYKAQAAKMREVAIESGKNTNAYRNEQTKLNNLGTTYTNHAKKVNSLRGSYGQLSDKSAASMDKISGHVNKMSHTGDKMISMGGALRNSTMLVGSAFSYGAKKATQLENTYVKISNLAKTGGENVSEATKNVSQMQKDGRKYSIQYGKSMTSIAHGYEDLVKRGYTTKQALGAMQGELQASVASGDKFSDVVQVASQTLEGFGMRAASSSKMTANTKEVVNDLAYAADMTASDFHSIGKGMEYVGATSHNMHFSLAETSAALGVLSNNGLEADKAGTGLRKTLISLASPSKAAWGALGEIGIKTQKQFNAAFKDSKGNFKSMSDILGTVWKKSKNLSSSDRGALFKNLFGTTGMQAAQILAKNSGELDKLTGKVAKAGRTGKYVKDLSARNAQTTAMALNKFKAAGTELAQSFAVSVLPAITTLTKSLSGAFKVVATMPTPLKNLITLVGVGVPLVAGLSVAIGGIIKSIKVQVDTFRWLNRVMHNNNYNKVSEQLSEQTIAFNDETKAIEENTLARQKNADTPVGGGPDGESGVGGTATKTERVTKEAKTVSTATKTEKVAEEAKSLNKFKSLGSLSRAGKAIVGSVGIFDVLLSLQNLIGINNNNKGSKIGATAGSLGGSSIGAAIGTAIAPGIGTAVVSMIGPIIGQTLGKTIGHEIQKDATNEHNRTKHQTTKQKRQYQQKHGNAAYYNNQHHSRSDYRPAMFGTGTYDVNAVIGNAKTKKNRNKKKPLPSGPGSQQWLNKNTSSKTKSTANSLNKLIENTNTAWINSAAYSDNIKHGSKQWTEYAKQTASELKKSYGALYSYVKNRSQKRMDSEKKNYDFLVKNHLLDSTTAEKQFNNEKQVNAKRLATLKSTLNSIATDQALSDKQRTKKMRDVNRQILQLTDVGSQKQKNILKSLLNSSRKLTVENYAKILQSSKKNEQKTIDSAKKSELAKIKAADDTYKKEKKAVSQIKGLSSSQRKTILANAKKQHDKTIGNAYDQYDQTVAYAKQQRKDVVEEAKKQAGQAANAFKTAASDIGSSIPALIEQNAGLFGGHYQKSKSNKQAVHDYLNMNDFKNAGKGHSKVMSTWKPRKKKKKKKFKHQPSSIQIQSGFATGGQITKPTTSMVGENGFEILQRGKKFSLIGSKGAQLIELLAGDRIYKHSDARKMLNGSYNKRLPGFSDGNADISSFAKGTKNSKGVQWISNKNSKLQLQRDADDEVSIAKKKYKDTVAAAKKQYKGNSKYAKAQRKVIESEARKQRDNAINEAEKQKKSLSTNAKKQYNTISNFATKQRKQVTSEQDKTSKYIDQKGRYNNSSTRTWWNKISNTTGNWLGSIAKKENKNIDANNKMFKDYGASGGLISKLPTAFASGTGIFSTERRAINKPTYSMLNDGNDSPDTNNRELAFLPNGNIFSPNERNWKGVLPAGTEVTNAKETKWLFNQLGIKRFAKGTGYLAKTAGSLKDKLAAALGLASNPKATFNKISDSNNSGIRGRMATTLNDGVHSTKNKYAYPWFSEAWKQIANAASDDSAGGAVTHSPGSGWSVSSGFGNRGNVSGGFGSHDGVDFSGGKTVHSMNTGTVFGAGGPPSGWGGNKGIGQWVGIKGGGLSYIYQELNGKYGSGAHLLVHKGDRVNAGDAIAILGPNGSHVHVGATKHKMFSIPGSSSAGWLDVRDLHGTSKKLEHKASSALSKHVKGQLKNAGVLAWVKKYLEPLSDEAGGDLGNPGGSSVSRWKDYVIKALKANHFSASPSQVSAWLKVIQRESHGDPKAVQPGSDPDHDGSGPARGLVQTKRMTFNAYKFKGHDNIYNGFDDLLAGIHYMSKRYGRGSSAFTRVASRGYEHGGLITRHQMAEIGEGNKPEMVIPLTNKNRAFSLIMQSLGMLLGNDSIRGKGKYSSDSSEKKLIDSLLKENKKKDKMLNKMLDKMDILINIIAKKPTGISPAQVYQANKQYSKQRSNLNALNRGEFNL